MSKFNEVLAKNIKDVPKAIGDFSHSVAFSHYNYLSAQLPIDPKTNQIVSGSIKEQINQVFKNLETIIKGIKHTMNDIVRVTIMTKNLNDLQIAKKVYPEFFKSYVPTLTALVVKNIPMKALIQVEAIVTNGEGTIPNAPQAGDLIKVINNSDKVFQCPCNSHSVAFSHYNNLTTQLPIDPQTGKIIDSSVKKQLIQCLRNIKNILESMDMPFDDIVKINIYLKDIKDVENIKETYKTFFPDSAIARAVNYNPALSFIEVADLEHGSKVQVEAIVSHGDGTPPQAIEDRHGIVIKANNTNKAPQQCIASQSVAFSHYNHLSTQYPIDLLTGALVSQDIEEQTRKCLQYLKNIVESINHKMDDIVKLNVYVKDLNNLEKISEVIKTFFLKTMPAGKFVEVGNIAFGAKIQIDAIVSNAEGTPPKHCNNCCKK